MGFGCLGVGGVETDGDVFPVADVVAEFERGVFKDVVALVEGEEGEVEDVGDVVGFWDCDDGAAYGVWGFACGVWTGAVEPGGGFVGVDAFVGVEVDIFPVVAILVEVVEIVDC